MIKNNYYYVLTVNLILTIVIYKLSFFASNDDPILSIIIGKKLYHYTIVINTILTKFIVYLYKFYPNINWYKLTLFSYIFVANTLIHYLLIKKFNTKIGNAIYTIYLISSVFIIEIYTSFTIIAMFLALISWIYIFQEDNKFQITGTITLILASLLRFTAIFPPLFITPLFISKKNIVKKLITIFLVLIIPFLLEKYNEYKHLKNHKYDIIKLHKYRLGIDTFLFWEKVPKNILEKTLNETNFTLLDIKLISNFYAPLEPDSKTLKRYKAFYQLKKHSFTKKWIKTSLLWIKIYLLKPPLFYILLITFIYFFISYLLGANIKFIILLSGLLLLAIFIISYFLTIPIYTRVSSLFVGSILIAILKIKKLKANKIVVLLASLLLYFTFNIYSFLYKEYKILQNHSECVRIEKEKKYLIFPGKYLEGLRVKIPKEINKNIIFCDWVFWLKSEYSEIKQSKGFINFIQQGNVYLVVENINKLEKLINFISREYGMELKYKIIYRGCDIVAKVLRS